jgi:hypothetical protein
MVFCWPRLSTAPHVLYAHAHNLAYYVGKGRQQASILYTIKCTARCTRGMCSTEIQHLSLNNNYDA